MHVRFLLALLLSASVAGCLGEPEAQAAQEAERPQAEVLTRGTGTTLSWSGNVTHDAAVSWSFQGSGDCGLTAVLHGGGGAGTLGAGILFDDGDGFIAYLGGTGPFVEAHAAGEHVRFLESEEWTRSLVEELEVSDGDRVLVFGRDLLPSPEMGGDSFRVDLACDAGVEAVDLRASREVVVLSDHGDGNGVGATVGMGPAVDVGTRLERTFTSEEVLYILTGQVSAAATVRVTHPAGEETHSWYGLSRETHTAPGGDLVIEVNRAGTQVAFLYFLFFGLHPVDSLDGIEDLPSFGADEWDWDGSTP